MTFTTDRLVTLNVGSRQVRIQPGTTLEVMPHSHPHKVELHYNRIRRDVFNAYFKVEEEVAEELTNENDGS